MNRSRSVSTAADTSRYSRQSNPVVTAMLAALVLVGGYISLMALCRIIIALGWYAA